MDMSGRFLSWMFWGFWISPCIRFINFGNILVSLIFFEFHKFLCSFIFTNIFCNFAFYKNNINITNKRIVERDFSGKYQCIASMRNRLYSLNTFKIQELFKISWPR